MLARRSRQTLRPALCMLALGGRQWARDAGHLVIYRLLGGLFLVVLLFSRAVMPPQMVHPAYHSLQDADADDFQRLMILSLEFKRNTFSGNGVYAQSIARSLARKGFEVLVLSGKPVRPAASTDSSSNSSREVEDGDTIATGFSESLQDESNSARNLHEQTGTETPIVLKKELDTGLIELEVEVEENGWGRLDWKCPWRSFAQGARQYTEHVLAFNPSWALVVDWSAIPALENLTLAANTHWRTAFLNFRIYYMSEYQGDDGEAEKQFYKEMESKAVAMASAVSALSSRDAHILATELGARIGPGVVPKPHFPPIREDLRTLALKSNQASEESRSMEGWMAGRKYFTCCVRISPEKNAQLFASIVEHLGDFLQEQEIIPFVCGGAREASSYVRQVKARVKAAMPEAIIYEGFMGPSQLSDLYSHTLLNLHPCIYDAYGMTIVEAAAFTSPSVVHVGPGGAVGAAEFLDPIHKQLLSLDLTQPLPVIADNIKKLLLDKRLLAEVGWEASRRSLSWNEDANAEQLISILRDAPNL